MDLPSAVDVAIVGGGFAGLSTAWALARRGLTRSIVLEREPALGAHASGKSAGLGRQLAEDDDTTALTVRGAALLRDDPDLQPAWAPTGGVLSFDDPAHLEIYAERARRFAIRVEPAEPRWPQLRGLRSAGALYLPSDGTIDVARLRAAFADRCDVRTGVQVTGIAAGRVSTAAGPIAARIIVDASGAWAGELVGAPPLASYKRHIFVLGSAPPARAPWVWHLGPDELYVRAAGGSTLACPCDAIRARAGDEHVTTDATEMFAARFASVPELTAARVENRYACLRAFTPDGRMRLGQDPERPWLFWSAGLGGHGATASAAVGERVADSIVRYLSQSATDPQSF